MHPSRKALLIAVILFLTLSIALESAPRADPPEQPASSANNTAAAPAARAAADVEAQDAGCASTAAADSNSAPSPHICDLLIAPSGKPATGHLALNDKLAIVLDSKIPNPADRYVLFLNDREVKGLEPAIYTT